MSSETYNINNSKICRTCLRSCDNSVHIFGEYRTQNNKNFKECLDEICNISVSPDDNLPESICAKCAELLKQSHNFRALARKNDNFLHKILQVDDIEESIPIKEEIENVERKEQELSPNSLDSKQNGDFQDMKTESLTQASETEDSSKEQLHFLNSLDSRQDEDFQDMKPETLVQVNEPEDSSDLIEKIDSDDCTENVEFLVDDESYTEEYIECTVSDVGAEELPGIVELEQLEIEEKSEFSEHSQSSDEMNFECKYCNKKFTHSRNKKKHEKRHTTEGHRECYVCQKKFYSNSDLKRHLYSHGNDRRFGCDICGKTYLSKSELNRHTKTHKNLVKFKCKFCTREFRELGILNFHTRTVHFCEKKHECTTCGKFFSTTSKVKRHQNTKACLRTKVLKTIHEKNRLIILEETECAQEQDNIENQAKMEDVWTSVMGDISLSSP